MVHIACIDFDNKKRYSREYYLPRQIVQRGGLVHRHAPRFMLPGNIKPIGYIDEAEYLHDASRDGSPGTTARHTESGKG